MIGNLPLDMLKDIMIRVARSSDGARNLARFTATCKAFHEFADDEDVLKAVVFDELLVSGRYDLFQHINGLVSKCAQAGHRKAQFILAKVILVSSSQLYARETETRYSELPSLLYARSSNLVEGFSPKSSFVAHFEPCIQSNKATARYMLHFDLVRFFLSQSSPSEITEMQPHLNDYMQYFLGCNGIRCEGFLCLLDKLCLFAEFDYPQIMELGEEMCEIYVNVYEAMLELVNLKEQYQGKELVDIKEQYDVSSFNPCKRIDIMIEHCSALKSIIKEAIVERHRRRDTTNDTEFDQKYEEVASVLQLRASRFEELLLRFKKVASRFEEIRGDAVVEFEFLFSLTGGN